MDLILQRAVASHQPAWVVAAARVVMNLGMTWWGVTTCLLVGGLVVATLRAWRPAVAAFAAGAVGTITARLCKAVIERPRPPVDLALVHPGGWSFPSTQATQTAAIVAAFIVAGTWTGRQHRLLALAGITAVALVGACMVSLGAHWASDVVAGWALGAVIGTVAGRFAARGVTNSRREAGSG